MKNEITTGSTLRTMLTMTLACLAPAASALDEGPTRLDEVLRHARAASHREHWSEHKSELLFEGQARINGVESDFQLFFCVDGQFRFHMSGPLANTSAWDGAKAWSQDAGAPSRELAFERRGRLLLNQWAHSGFWSDEEAPLEIHLVSESTSSLVLGIAISDAAESAQLVLDKTTWLPVELRYVSSGVQKVLEFGDYREVHGVPVAHELKFTGGSVSGFVHVSKGGLAEAQIENRYNLAGHRSTDTWFDPDLPAEVEMRRVKSGHLLVNVTVNDEGDQWFILDTGAGRSCIDPVFADTLEMPKFGEVSAIGVAGSVTANYRQGSSFALGPLEITDPVFVELDLSFLEPHFGVRVAGICGYDLFVRSIVEMDLEGPRAFIHNPSTFELKGGHWSPMLLEKNLPSIECTFEAGRKGVFVIDTGDSGAVVFNTAAVKELALLEERELNPTKIGGVGGSASAHSGQLEWFELGGRRFDNVVATFKIHDDGSKPNSNTIGAVGSKLFQPFHVFFDYSGRRLGLVPRGE
ncbi:MAG: putative aspartyl protease [Planctomycetota bacterium]|jgi:predicted aspartyl protease